ncbi:MAG TPA: SMP-30/gluconolactonase/LRE family protein [Verrucomicrobiae bacterium]
MMNAKTLLALSLASTLHLSAADAGSETNLPPQMRRPDPEKAYPWIGKIERMDPELDQLLAPHAVIEKLAAGFEWSEGPVWVKRGGFLLFSDVPNNIVYKWTPYVGTTEFLFPSGYTGEKNRGGEPGSNGLTVDKQGRLVLAQHGDRQIGRLEKGGKVKPLAEFYQKRRFNSPNDLVYHSNGDLYFTDPPYGLEKNNADPAKEINFNGVYRLTPKGQVHLLVSNISFPNGIALSPDEGTLYVAVSDGKKPVIMAYSLTGDKKAVGGRVFFDSAPLMQGRKGVTDGLKVDKKGNLWATGPGGVMVINPEGKLLGIINTGEATANCAFGGADGSMLYITADMYLCRIQTLTQGIGF